MKKIILFAIMAMVAMALLGQEQEQTPVPPDEQPLVQAEKPAPVPVQPQGRDLKIVRFPAAFIQAGREYPAGNYWLTLSTGEDRSFFTVQDAQKTVLFEELAIVKPHAAEGTQSHFHVNIGGTKGNEYFRVKVTTQGEWLLGYFLLKK